MATAGDTFELTRIMPPASYRGQRYRAKKNVIHLIHERQRMPRCQRRRDLFMIRMLVESKYRSYEEIWGKSSASPISYDGHLYFTNFRVWFGGCFSGNGKPHLLHNNFDRSTNWRIEDAIRFESPTILESHQRLTKEIVHSHAPSLLSLTSDGWLVRSSQTPGWKVLQRVYLSERYHFKHINWVSNIDTFALKSIHFCGPGTVSRNSTLQDKPYLYLALFKTAPLSFVVNIALTKAVWGNDLVDANLANAMLVTMHRRDIVKFYDLDYIISRYRSTKFNLGDQIEDSVDFKKFFPHFSSGQNGSMNVGHYPLGIPLNFMVTERPPVLFQVTSCQSIVSFGGFPWRVIVSRNQLGNLFNVYDVAKGTVDAVIKTMQDPFCQERTFFHEDQSGRILSLEQQSVRCLSIQRRTNGEFYCHCHFEIELSKDNSSASRPEVSQSGRSIKWRNNEEMSTGIIYDVDYDDELDILVVLSSHNTSLGCKGHLGIYDNQTGHKLKQFFIDEYFDDVDDWSVYVDRDLILCICKRMVSGSKFRCKMFKLVNIIE